MHATYETFQQVHEYKSKNIPEYDLFELSESLKKSLKTAGVGVNRPLIIFGYSMGGVITKILLNIDSNLAENTKGIVFFVCPHFGSDVRDDTFNQLGEMISGMNRFISQHSIEDDEFVNFFLDKIDVSKTANFLISPDRAQNLGLINDQFKKYDIKTMSIIEGKEVSFLSHNSIFIKVCSN